MTDYMKEQRLVTEREMTQNELDRHYRELLVSGRVNSIDYAGMKLLEMSREQVIAALFRLMDGQKFYYQCGGGKIED